MVLLFGWLLLLLKLWYCFFFKQEKPVVFSYRLSLRFGTDLLSHVLPQYHWLWWA
jgi:hypothetical protein